MSVNITCVPGNATSECLAPGSSAGLAVGLTFFFLLLVIAAGVILYKYHSKIRNMQLGHKKEIEKKEPQTDSHLYTSMIIEQSAGQAPIYENLTRTTGNKRPKENQSRSPGEPEENLYLRCDLTDDAIYSNDPACNLAVHQDHHEDVYIVPDS